MKSPEPSSHRTAPRRATALSVRQLQCLRLAAEGLTSSAIAERVGISPRTVDEHLMMACSELGVRTRVQAVAHLALEARRAVEGRSFLP